VGAKVNGKMVPLRYQLRNGNIVEITTSAKQHPNKDWLKFVKTSKAKTKIRQWIRTEEREESINFGRTILEKALHQEGLGQVNVLKSDQIAAVAKELSFQSVEDLIAQIGFGKISPRQVLGRMKPRLDFRSDKARGLVSKMVSRFRRPKTDHGIKVNGVSDMLIHFAKCCCPLPGERVVGFITRGRGITVHLESCRHVQKADPDRLVPVSWDPTEKEGHAATLRVTSVERKGALADISTIISQKDANIIHAEIKTTVDNKGISYFTIEVEDYKQLQDIVNAIKKVRNVLIVERL
jgi:GTP pyrophosphokinase